MNYRGFAAFILIILLAGAAAAAYASFKHAAFIIGDGKDINLFGNLLGNGTIRDVSCISNCSNFNVTSTETNATNLTSGTVANARLTAAAANFNQSYSYLIYQYAETVYAKNGSTGIVDYSGVDAGTISNQIADRLPQGNYSLKFSCGKFVLTNTSISFRNNTEISGSGDCTIFRQSGINNTVGEEIRPIKYRNVKLHDFAVDGNKSEVVWATNDAYGNGIRVNYFDDVDIDNVFVYDTMMNGITLYQCNNCTVQNSRIYRTGKANPSGTYSLNGIIVEFNSNNLKFINNIFKDNNQTGIQIIAGGSTNDGAIISKNTFYNTATDAINLREQNKNISNYIISENLIFNPAGRGIRIDPINVNGKVNNIVMINNIIKNSGSHSIDLNSLSETANNSVIGNMIMNSGGIGISFANTANYSLIANNYVQGSTTADIRNNGIGNVLSGNFNTTS